MRSGRASFKETDTDIGLLFFRISTIGYHITYPEYQFDHEILKEIGMIGHVRTLYYNC